MSDAKQHPTAATPSARFGFMVGLTALLHAIVFGAAAKVLPWDEASSFGLSAAALALGHLAVAVAVWTRRPQARSIWRFVSAGALVFVGLWAYLAASAGVYLARVYGGLGEGLAVATAAAFAPLVLFTVPFALWGLVATRRGGRPSRGMQALSALALFVAGGGLVQSCAAARPTRAPTPEDDVEAFRVAVADELGDRARGIPGAGRRVYTLDPVQCAEPIEQTDKATVVVSFSAGPGTQSLCLQADEDEIVEVLATTLAEEVVRGPAKIDLITAWDPLEPDHPTIAGLQLRPGLDGACIEGRCLMPWQLVASDQFTKFVPFAFIQDLRVGFDPAALAETLGVAAPASIAGITRLETQSLLMDASGRLHSLVRGRVLEPVVDREHSERAVREAAAYIVSAQEKDGRFRYTYDPFTGKIDRRNYNLPRQAGTTLALCELGGDEGAVDRVVERSLAFMAKRAREHGELSFLTKRAKMDRAHLGSTALPLIAFAECRDRVGQDYDTLMGGLARGLMALQNEDGSFAPAWNREADAPQPGPEPLFAAGQVVFALSAMEGIQRGERPVASWPSADELGAVVDRAMDHYAGPYWNHALAQFFWIEENWHCLAARASLGHHRHDGYERMCLDYIHYKHRLSLDEDSRVNFDFVGGYGFGNVVAPHNTGTAGYGEALAAGIAIARARGEDTSWMEADLRAAHRFLLRQQFDPLNGFAAQREPRVRGAFSESMSAPLIRIDYVQHAMAALGHGARVLYDEG